MRKFAFMFGCAALLSVGAFAASDHSYRVDFRFSKSSVNYQSFTQDRERCVAGTSTRRKFGPEAIGGSLNVGLGSSSLNSSSVMVFPRPTYDHDVAAFYRCMMARGYRADPNGQFTVSLSARL